VAARLIAAQSTESHRLVWIRRIQGLAGRGAYACARDGRIGDAIHFLHWTLRLENPAPGAEDLGEPASPPSAEGYGRVAVAVPPAVDAVVFVLAAPAGAAALAATARGTSVAWLDFNDADSDGWVEALTNLATPGDPAGQLFDRLGVLAAGPVAGLLRTAGARKVGLIPIGRLACLPFHAARLGAKAGYFLDEFEVSYAPDLASLMAAHHRAQESTAPPAFLGVANPKSELPPLPGAEAEARAVAALFPNRPDVQLLLGPKATREEVLHRLSAGTGPMILHFAGHGTFEPDRPDQSGLILSGLERLTVQDLLTRRGRIRPRLLVISSSSSAARTDSRGLPDRQVGLPTAFLRAGARGMIGALWHVQDPATALLMTEFYRQYTTSGRPPAAALRAAQLWLRDATAADLSAALKALAEHGPDQVPAGREVRFALAEPEDRPFADPFYWAPFILVGA
jgi:CHAT domain-containing protein